MEGSPDPPGRPEIRALSLAEMEDILARNELGRLAYVEEGGEIAIEPLHYVYADGALWGRTSPGSKISALWQKPTVTFEVDEVDGPLDWRSVVVHGVFHRVRGAGSPTAVGSYEEGVRLIRTREPYAFGPDDPVPDRTILFRIPINRVTGRGASSDPARPVDQRPGAPGPQAGADDLEETVDGDDARAGSSHDAALLEAAPSLSTERRSYEAAPGLLRRLRRKLLRFDLFWKILVANFAVVLVATLVAVWAAAPSDGSTHLARSTPVILGAVALTAVLNAAILRVALRPVRQLAAAARRVAGGDLSARTPTSPLADSELFQLGSTFNDMVESIESYRNRLRAVATRAATQADEQRRRVSRNLQEESAQSLAHAMLLLRALRDADPDTRADLLDDLRAELAAIIEQLQACATELRPSALDMLGVGAAIEAYANEIGRRSGVAVHVQRDPGPEPVPGAREMALFRIVQEALDNVEEHSAAAHARVVVRRHAESIVAEVEDDGLGFAVHDVLRHGDRALGLFGMQESAAYFGGTVQFQSRPGAGARVRVEIPLSDAAGTLAMHA